MSKKLSDNGINVWRVYGQVIHENRCGNSGVQPGYGIRSIADKFNLGFRESERLLQLIDKYGPTPPDEQLIQTTETKEPSSHLGPDETEWRESDGGATVTGRVKTLDDLIKAAGIDTDKWRVDQWQSRTWDANIGDGKIETMHYVKALLERRIGEKIYGAVHVPKIQIKEKANQDPREFEKVFIIPDTQVGYRRSFIDGSHYLEPMHDRLAMDAVWRVCSDTQPHTIILLGDMLDLAEMSTKYPRPKDLINTSQPAILETAWWCRRLREMCPSSKIIFMEGNHEARVERLLIEKASMAQGLTAASDELPALSIDRLLGLADLDIEYKSPFGVDYWLWPDSNSPVKIHHGEIVRAKGGQTVAAQLAKYHHSVIGGHIHRVELAMATNHGPQGTKQRFAMSPGCLCRTDGAVPGATLHPDWQQGFGIIYRDPATGQVHPSVYSVLNGTTVFSGKHYQGKNMESRIAIDLNWKEISKSI